MSQSSASAAAAPRRNHEQLFSIGEVLAQLQADFPALTHSKVRFLEEQGLVTPRRTPSNYRKFTSGDIQRLHTILTLQRDHFMPLRAIAEYLDAGAEPLPMPGKNSIPRRMSAGELIEAGGTTPEFLEDLISFGLIEANPSGSYDTACVQVVRAAVQLRSHGVQPRNLRAVRTAVERELALIDQVVSPLRHQRSAGAAGQADEVRQDLATLFLQLHAGMLTASSRHP